MLCDNVDLFTIQQLQVEEVKSRLECIKANTASGSDNITATVIKELAKEIAYNVTKIMNCSIATNSVPDQWKKANVKIIWKGKGSKDEPVNYRPISVLPILARVFEKAVLNSYTLFVIADRSFRTNNLDFDASQVVKQHA